MKRVNSQQIGLHMLTLVVKVLKLLKMPATKMGNLCMMAMPLVIPAAALAPVRWDNYVVEADLTFEQVLNSARWASVVARASDNGLNQYNQMAVRQNGSFEFAYRTPTNSWSVPVAENGHNLLL